MNMIMDNQFNECFDFSCDRECLAIIKTNPKGGKHMTHMQVEYSKYLEGVRHNQETERLTQEQNVETERSHRAQETISNRDIDEKIRHNQVSETETSLHNRITEQETATHNRNTEALTRASYDVQMRIAEMTQENTKLRADTDIRLQEMKQSYDNYKHTMDINWEEFKRYNLSATEQAQIQKWEQEVNQQWEKIDQGWASIDNELTRLAQDKQRIDNQYEIDKRNADARDLEVIEKQYANDLRAAEDEWDVAISRRQQQIDAVSTLYNGAANVIGRLWSGKFSSKSNSKSSGPAFTMKDIERAGGKS